MEPDPRGSARPLRVGVLGTARITPTALLGPARSTGLVTVEAIAARDEARARRFAARHDIPRVHRHYEDLIADPDLDAIYNPLPNSLHAVWTIRALEAGRHVLCEKPLAANAVEAQQVVEAAARAGRVVVEAMHWRHHPLADRLKAIVDSGEIGRVGHIEAAFCILLPSAGDIRYRLDLAGGAAMDLGCYTVSLVRHLAGAEPTVVSAEARPGPAGVDRWLRADLRFDDGRTARVTCALWSRALVRLSARVIGDGELRVVNPFLPHLFHRVRVRNQLGWRAERVTGESTYVHQLRAFVDAVRHGPQAGAGVADAVATMRLIDALYAKAGLPRREGAGPC